MIDGIIIRELSLFDNPRRCTTCEEISTHILIRKKDLLNYDIDPIFLCTRHSFDARRDRINLTNIEFNKKYPQHIPDALEAQK